jgi:hypothetical protein
MTAPVSPSAPVAWYDPTNKNPGQSVTFSRADHERWPHIYRVALYASPAPSMVGLRETIERLTEAASASAGSHSGYAGSGWINVVQRDLQDILALLAREGVGG